MTVLTDMYGGLYKIKYIVDERAGYTTSIKLQCSITYAGTTLSSATSSAIQFTQGRDPTINCLNQLAYASPMQPDLIPLNYSITPATTTI